MNADQRAAIMAAMLGIGVGLSGSPIPDVPPGRVSRSPWHKSNGYNNTKRFKKKRRNRKGQSR